MANVDQARTWIPIAIAFSTLVAGGGWLQFILSRRRERRERYRLLLKELRQFELILQNTRARFSELIKDPTLQNLEGRPSALQKYFASLPTEDPRRLLWKIRIEQLRQDNQSGAIIVNGFQSLRDDRAILAEFTTGCARYLEHVDRWEAVWKAVETSLEASDEPLGLFAPPFPSELEPALSKQIKEVARRAGLAS